MFRPPKTKSAMEWLASQFRRYLHMPDLGPLYLLMGAVAANLLEGEPVWLMLVGPPGCGKTELLNSLLDLKGIDESASISDLSAFLSATATKDRSEDASGGILRRVGAHGGVVINDFTSVISLEKKVLDRILGVFREVYSGRWTRDVGSEGGRKLHWEGKVAFFAGVTTIIDRHHETNSSLGERWLRFTMPEADEFERSRRRLGNNHSTGWQQALKDAVTAFFAGLQLEFGQQRKPRELTPAETLRIIRMGTVAARCRSAVVRDPFTREVITAKETEVGTRIVTALGQLFLGMEVIGVSEEDRWRLIGSVALDSMPRLRLLVLQTAKGSKNGVTNDELIFALGCSRSTVTRTVEELQIHGVVQKEKIDGLDRVQLTKWMADEWKACWGNGASNGSI